MVSSRRGAGGSTAGWAEAENGRVSSHFSLNLRTRGHGRAILRGHIAMMVNCGCKWQPRTSSWVACRYSPDLELRTDWWCHGLRGD